jgi:molybdate transport system substrate-binding protein
MEFKTVAGLIKPKEAVILRVWRMFSLMNRLGVGMCVTVVLGALACSAQDLTVAAASDLQSVMPEVVMRFQRQSGKSVRVSYGSSGNFFQQLQNGAPFDAFFSANVDYVNKLEEAGLTEPGSSYQYARGKLVLWVRSDSPVNVKLGLRVLLEPAVKKISIANPLHAPYGQAAVAAMQKESVYEKVRDKLVRGENISQAASFVMSGAADVGLVALSTASSPNMRGKGIYAEVPAEDYPPINQVCVALKSSKNKTVARQFLSYFKTAEIRELLTSYGFEVSEASR